MRKGVLATVLSLVLMASAAGTSFGAHPLITDDTGTQGKGKLQFEFIGEYAHDKENGVTEKGYETPTIPFLSYGLSDSIDIVFGLPYVSVITKEAETAAVRGLGDASIEVKALFYEKEGLTLALKPGLSLPTGDEEKGLGNGKMSYSAFFITTKESEPWAFHFNVGYVRNEYKLDVDNEANRKDIWHISLASQVEVIKDLNLVANIGMERNPDKTSDTHPAFILGGFIYSVSENVDIDMGIKSGLNKTETDYSILVGITWRI